MWKRFLQVLVESCAYMDPHAHMYYSATKQKAAERALTEHDAADEQEILRVIQRLESRREATTG